MEHIWLATFLISLLGVSGQLQLRNVLSNCLDRPNSNLNDCLLELSQELRPYMKTGIPSLNIPQTEPMNIERIAFELKSPFGTVNVVFTENIVSGLSDHEVIYIDADKEKFNLAVKIRVNNAVARGLYHMSGVLGPLELDAKLKPENYVTTFIGTTVEGVAQLSVVDGKLEIQGDPDVTVEVEDLDVKMDNLFGGTAEGLAKIVLKVVNKDSQQFIKDFQPEIRKQVARLIKGFFNSALANIPVNTFQ